MTHVSAAGLNVHHLTRGLPVRICLPAVISARRNTFPKETCCHLQTSDADRQNLKSNGDAAANQHSGRGTYMERDNRLNLLT